MTLLKQMWIVVRVEELLRWCDLLEWQLDQPRILAAHLLDSSIYHMLADDQWGPASAVLSKRIDQ
jgi:hypothetical protein